MITDNIAAIGNMAGPIPGHIHSAIRQLPELRIPLTDERPVCRNSNRIFSKKRVLEWDARHAAVFLGVRDEANDKSGKLVMSNLNRR
jgi:hypothetical protein